MRGFQQAVGDHVLAAVVAFFTGLEHKLYPALDFLFIVHQQLGGTQQHGRVGIVSTGVCRMGVLACKRLARLLGHGKRVHIAAQQDHFAVRITVQHGNHTAAHIVGFISHAAQFGSDIGAGVGQDSTDLRIFVNVSSPPYDLRSKGFGLVQQFAHVFLPPSIYLHIKALKF